jgi:tetratricopeptide (TPR) repeat protein
MLAGGVGCLQTGARPGTSKESQVNLSLAEGRLMESNAAVADTPAQMQRDLRERSRQAFRKALELDAKNVEAVLALARLSAADGDPDHAKQYLVKATQDHPKVAAVWYQLGMYHRNRKEWQPAIDNLKRANQVEPDNREITTQLGYTLARAGQIDQSVAVMATIKGNAQAHYDAARMLAHLKRFDESKQHLHMALRDKSDLQPARELLAQLEGGRAPQEGSQGVVTIDFRAPAPD